MSFLSAGFDAGTQLFPWGATLLDALPTLPKPVEANASSVKFQSSDVFSLTGIFNISLRAPAFDRPVLQADYEWVDASEHDVIAGFTRIFGRPAKKTDYDMSQYRQPIWAVKSAFGWQVDAGFRTGLSIYGAPRETLGGLAAGIFYIHWEDELTAAAPYLTVMTEFENWLKVCAARAEPIWQGTLEENQGRYPMVVDAMSQRAWRSLRKRLLYQTPPTIAALLQPNQVLVWKDVPDAIWCISTHAETVCFQAGQSVSVTHLNLLPAKGGGATTVSISDLTLNSIPNSAALVQLTHFLREEMGVQVSFIEDYDM